MSSRPFKPNGNLARLFAKQGCTLSEFGLSVSEDIPSRTESRQGISSFTLSQPSPDSRTIGTSDRNIRPGYDTISADEAPTASRESPSRSTTTSDSTASKPRDAPPSEEDESNVDSDSVWEFQRKASPDGIPMLRTPSARPSALRSSPLRNGTLADDLPNLELEDYNGRSGQVQIIPNRTLTRSPLDDFDAKPEERGRSGFPGRASTTLEIPALGRPLGRSVSAEPPQTLDVPLVMDTMLSSSAPTASHLRTPSGTIDTGISRSVELSRLSGPPDPLRQATLPAALAHEGKKKKKGKKHRTLSEFLHKGSQASSSSSSLLTDLFRI